MFFNIFKNDESYSVYTMIWTSSIQFSQYFWCCNLSKIFKLSRENCEMVDVVIQSGWKQSIIANGIVVYLYNDHVMGTLSLFADILKLWILLGCYNVINLQNLIEKRVTSMERFTVERRILQINKKCPFYSKKFVGRLTVSIK